MTGLRIAADLSSASFEFDRAFLQAPGQTFSQFLLTPGPPGVLPIAPEEALVGGSYSIGSLLFSGTVTVNVVPEPSGLSLVLLGSAALMMGHRRRPSGSRSLLTAPRVSTPIPRVTRLLVSRTGTENPVQTLWDRNDRRPDLTHRGFPVRRAVRFAGFSDLLAQAPGRAQGACQRLSKPARDGTGKHHAIPETRKPHRADGG